MASKYARVFDVSSTPFWQKDPEMNRIFLQLQQHHMNERLRVYGFVFLNEVYEALGLSRTVAGQITGWLKNGGGAGYIEFLMNEADTAIEIDFNVDGVMYAEIEG